ncbi:MAG TPA: SDR family NAD(P)-dependent oxidoreductase [Actinomycetota bacterium]|nr:SDR family NAD(P)-dependent oxidoreductase [Actinomycetota bacterium]
MPDRGSGTGASGPGSGASGRVLEGKVAIVTGASRGIGRAIAEALSREGAAVVLAARGAQSLEAAASAIEGAGGRALAVPTDVTDPARMDSLVEAAVGRFGTVDILVSNAGAAPFMAPTAETRPDGFDRYFRANFAGALNGIRSVAPVLLAKGDGCVVNVASVAGLVASPGLAYYATAKAAVISLTRTVSVEWASSGVRVNALAPGWIATEMNEDLRRDRVVERTVLEGVPMRRWGSAEEVAGAALFLCSPVASFVTGTVLVVDGGQSAGSLGG